MYIYFLINKNPNNINFTFFNKFTIENEKIRQTKFIYENVK